MRAAALTGVVLASALLLWFGLYLWSGTLERNSQISTVGAMVLAFISLPIMIYTVIVQLRQASSSLGDAAQLDQAAKAPVRLRLRPPRIPQGDPPP
jgi:ABC-type phosphate transport system permease subunit